MSDGVQNRTPSSADILCELEGAQIFIVPYAHCDWAWVHTRRWHEARYAEIIRRVLEILGAHAEFRWYMDNYRMELVPFLHKYPELIGELRRAVHEGKIGVCGGYSNVRPNMVGDETFIRNLIIGRRYFRALFPDADLSVHADIVDVALGHPQMPQILRKAGYNYFRCWRPHEVMTVKGIPNEFIWEGLDGTQILVSRGCYAGLIQGELAQLISSLDSAEPSSAAASFDKTVEALYRLELSYILSTSRTKLLWVSHGGDDALPLAFWGRPDAENLLDLPALVREWNRRLPIPMRFATPLEFFRALEGLKGEAPLVGEPSREAGEGSKIPLVRGTIDPCDVCYNAAWNGEKGLWALRYQGDAAIVEAEKWSCLAGVLRSQDAPAIGPAAPAVQSPDDRPIFETLPLWEDLLIACAHATQWLFEEDFAEVSSLAARAITSANRMKENALRAIMKSIKIPESSVAVIFNSETFERTCFVNLTLPVPDLNRVALKDGRGGAVEFQPVKSHNALEWDVLAKVELPAFGYNCVVMETSEAGSPQDKQPPGREAPVAPVKERKGPSASPASYHLSNGRVRLNFSAGRLVEIFDETSGRPYSSSGIPWNHLRYSLVDTTRGMLHVGPVVGRCDVEWQTQELIEAGPLRWMLRLWGRLGVHPVVQDVILHKGTDRIDFITRVDWKGGNGFLMAMIPLASRGELWGDIPFGIERKPIETEPYGEVGELPGRGWDNVHRQREGMFFAKSFVIHAGDEYSAVYWNVNGDRYFIYDKEEKALGHILINSFRRPEGTWEEYINEAIEGVGNHEFRYSIGIIPGASGNEGGCSDPCASPPATHPKEGLPWAELMKVSASLRHSQTVLRPERHTGAELPPFHSLVSVSPDHVALLAMYLEGEDVILRVVEPTGKPALVELKVPFAAKDVWAEELTGNRLEAPCPQIKEGCISFEIRPWEVVTLRCRI